MDTLLSLRVFAAVAELKSFSAAAERTGLSAAMATKHVQHLERRVGARLFNRTSRTVSLTEAGTLYLRRVGDLLESLDDVEATLAETTLVPRGRLRLSLPPWMANPSFVRLVAHYAERFPEVLLDLDLEGRMVNLVEEGFDLALRATTVLDDGLVARRVGEVRFHMVAAPSLLERIGTPRRIADLDGLPLLAYTPVIAGGRIRLGHGDEAREVRFAPVLQTTHEGLLHLAAVEGLGVNFAPSPLVEEDVRAGRLVRLLGDELDLRSPLFAVYPNRAQLPAKVRSFLDFLSEYHQIWDGPSGRLGSLAPAVEPGRATTVRSAASVVIDR